MNDSIFNRLGCLVESSQKPTRAMHELTWVTRGSEYTKSQLDTLCMDFYENSLALKEIANKLFDESRELVDTGKRKARRDTDGNYAFNHMDLKHAFQAVSDYAEHLQSIADSFVKLKQNTRYILSGVNSKNSTVL